MGVMFTSPFLPGSPDSMYALEAADWISAFSQVDYAGEVVSPSYCHVITH